MSGWSYVLSGLRVENDMICNPKCDCNQYHNGDICVCQCLDTYKPISHKAVDCRNDHPTLYKVPVGFRGFHDEDYED